ncbi:hypothetical protein [Natroniella sp. ANB-PHB2]|uniref:hypothetical protein n=1 Tax=Natroniella sp. ANB-PHB2 TaxID=3384444 RepID=UPI0038D50E65
MSAVVGIAGLIIASLVIYLLGYPFFEDDYINYQQKIIELKKKEKLQQTEIFTLLDELELDKLMGKVSEKKYRCFKKSFQQLIVDKNQ